MQRQSITTKFQKVGMARLGKDKHSENGFQALIPGWMETDVFKTG